MYATAAKATFALGLIDSGVRSDRFPATTRRVFLETTSGALPGSETIVRDHGSEIARCIADDLGALRVDLFDAQVFGAELATNADTVARALDWLAECGVDVVNMSFGLRENRPALRDACLRARRAGALLIAATPIVGAPVYPAAYPEVIAVSGDARCTEAQWSYFGTEPPRFGASPLATEAESDEAHQRGGSSYACARVSAQVLHQLASGVAVDAIPESLIRGAAIRGEQTRPGADR